MCVPYTIVPIIWLIDVVVLEIWVRYIVYNVARQDIFMTEQYISSTRMKSLLKDLKLRPVLVSECRPKRRVRTTIWICIDDGCNSNGHGEVWAKAHWISSNRLILCSIPTACIVDPRHEGIGNARVETMGKRRLPTAFRVVKMPEANNVTAIFSDFSEESQARMGFCQRHA